MLLHGINCTFARASCAVHAVQTRIMAAPAGAGPNGGAGGLKLRVLAAKRRMQEAEEALRRFKAGSARSSPASSDRTHRVRRLAGAQTCWPDLMASIFAFHISQR